ncbi:hypothetical protein BKA66DRAFT_425977 [Pyrenochaeta sp. MPI-SDFR-AT-0127]|nr:hypothetical protein BKA66DRAFT_425977 [Pyrenochaeta sp. MPI-SDFR-AT-0127]
MHAQAHRPDPGAVRTAHEATETEHAHIRAAHEGRPHLTALDTTLTNIQTHHMRSSPPIQPGEQNYPGKLPSFSEFLHTTRANTPPRTPSRRDGSATSSPQAQQHFDDVAWTDGKRRRVDTLGDIYARPTATEQLPADPRRMSTVIDPSLAGYDSPRVSQLVDTQSAVSVHHHRPSHSYPPPPHPSVPAGAHFRHQSSPPVSQGNAIYTQQPLRQSPYPQQPVQNSAMYEQRPNYYQDAQSAPHAYGYERSHDSYYTQPSYPVPGYENPYGDIRFQHNVGLEQNAFNRKRRGNLPKEATNMLKEWFSANRSSPYPTEDQKLDLCSRTGLSLNQVSNWFINARRRAPQKEQREREANNSEG